MITEIALQALSFGLGISLVSYRSMAGRNGWIIGAWLQKEASVPAILGFVLCVLTVGRGLFHAQPVWLIFAAVPAGYLLGMASTVLLKNWTPVIFVPLSILSLLVQIWSLT